MSNLTDSLIPRIGGVIDKHIRPIFKGNPRKTYLTPSQALDSIRGIARATIADMNRGAE